MSPDLDKYRAEAQAAGDPVDYSDEAILRLWAILEHLTTRALSETCPHLLEEAADEKIASKAFAEVVLDKPPTQKETSL